MIGTVTLQFDFACEQSLNSTSLGKIAHTEKYLKTNLFKIAENETNHGGRKSERFCKTYGDQRHNGRIEYIVSYFLTFCLFDPFVFAAFDCCVGLRFVFQYTKLFDSVMCVKKSNIRVGCHLLRNSLEFFGKFEETSGNNFFNVRGFVLE